MKRIFLITLVSMLLLVLVSPAGACKIFTLVGGPYESTSWSQDLQYWNWSSNPYDTFELFITSGGSLQYGNDGMRDFSESTWSSSYINKHYALASGASTLEFPMDFTVDFAGDMTDPLSFDILAWSGGINGIIRAVYHYDWTGSELTSIATIVGLDRSVFAFEALDRHIPEPSSMLLLGVGLIGVGFLRRKFKR